MSRIALILPTLNASKHLDRLLPALASQSLQADEILVIDSDSSDDTVQRMRQFGARVAVIERSQFNHGGTRAMACGLVDADTLILLTQDAIPHKRAFERICAGLRARRDIGMAYGRQLPHIGATVLASQARHFNYPPTSRIKRMCDAPELGIKTCFSSNSFAAYKRDALESAGNFPDHVICSEDAYMAANLLLKDWAIHYVADACVEHSHNYRIRDEFRRYFDIGVLYGRESWITKAFGGANGEGVRFVLSELSALRKAGELWRVPEAMLRNLAKLLGYHLGLNERAFPNVVKRHIGMFAGYWEDQS